MTSRIHESGPPILGLIALLAVPAAAQFGQQDPIKQSEEEALRQRWKDRQERERRIYNYTFPYSMMPKDAPMPFHMGFDTGVQRVFPFYEGLPTYPSNVPGYGGYPGAGAKAAERRPGNVTGLEKPPPDKDRWPSWIEGGADAKGMRATARQAVLVRVADRVWYRATGEPSFIPLAFHDRFRFMTAGAQVEVRGKGEYQVVLHTGGSIRSRGPCALRVTAMNAEELALQLGNVDQMWIKAGLRPVRITMPDRTALTFADTLLHLERRGDRCVVANLGGNPVRFAGPVGEGKLDGPMRIHLWMQPAARPPLPAAFATRGEVETTEVGAVTTVRGGAGGKVISSGASFAVPLGATLTLQPLAPAETSR